MLQMIKLGFLKSLIVGTFLGFFFYETSFGNSVSSILTTHLSVLGEYNTIVLPLIIVTLSCILIDNKFSGLLVGIILGIILFDFPFYGGYSSLLVVSISQGNTQSLFGAVDAVLNRLRNDLRSFPFIVTIVTSASIGFSIGRYAQKTTE